MWEALGTVLDPEQKLNTSFLCLLPLPCSSQASFWAFVERPTAPVLCVCAHVPKHTFALLIRRMA